MRRIFNEDALNNKILNDGYLVIPDFLNNEELNIIRNDYQNLRPKNVNKSSYSSYELQDLYTRRQINQSIRTAIARSVNHYYDNYKPLTGIFISKPPHCNTSKIDLHFDSNCIEENGYESTVIWISLHDVNEENGTLHIFKGSHLFMHKIRPFEAPFCYKKYYDFFEKNFMKPISLKAGDALIFLNRTLHYSNHNNSPNERISFRIDMIPKELNAIQYYCDKTTPKKQVKVYKIDDCFYERFTRDKAPTNDYFEKFVVYNEKELSKEELNKIISNIDKAWNNKIMGYALWKYKLKKLLNKLPFN